MAFQSKPQGDNHPLMAFQPKPQGDKHPVMSIRASIKQGNSYSPGPSCGFWSNDQGGPAFRGTLKGEMLEQWAEFLANAAEVGLSVSLSLFDNSQQAPKQQGFRKPAGFQPKQPVQQRKPNPFKKPDAPDFGGE